MKLWGGTIKEVMVRMQNTVNFKKRRYEYVNINYQKLISFSDYYCCCKIKKEIKL